MINHIRTLLVNRSGADGLPAGYPGEEYVPADFRPRNVAASLVELRKLLLGSQPDRAYLNLRLWQFLALLHAMDETRDYLTELDTRLTYYPFRRNDFFNRFLQGPTTTTLAGTAALFVNGYLQARGLERLYHDFTLTVHSGTELRIQYVDRYGVAQNVLATYATVGGMGGPVSLPETALTVLFQPTVASSWQVVVVLRPEESFAALLARVETLVSSSMEEALFGAAREEPYASLQAMWRDHPQRLGRLAGLLLALAWRTGEASP